MSLRDTPRSPEHAEPRPHDDGASLSPDLEQRILVTRAALLWEELCVCFWPLALYVGVLAALSLLDVWQSLPGLIHAGLFWVAFAGFLYLAWRGLMRFDMPRRADAIERLERGNRLAHRPIAALADVMAERPAAIRRTTGSAVPCGASISAGPARGSAGPRSAGPRPSWRGAIRGRFGPRCWCSSRLVLRRPDRIGPSGF